MTKTVKIGQNWLFCHGIFFPKFEKPMPYLQLPYRTASVKIWWAKLWDKNSKRGHPSYAWRYQNVEVKLKHGSTAKKKIDFAPIGRRKARGLNGLQPYTRCVIIDDNLQCLLIIWNRMQCDVCFSKRWVRDSSCRHSQGCLTNTNWYFPGKHVTSCDMLSYVTWGRHIFAQETRR